MKPLVFAAMMVAVVGCGKTEKTTEIPSTPPAEARALKGVPGQTSITAPVVRNGGDRQNASTPVVIANDETLAAYNKALRAWIDTTSYLPMNAKELATLRNGPKPPQPPPGRVLVFDRTTWKVHLE